MLSEYWIEVRRDRDDEALLGELPVGEGLLVGRSEAAQLRLDDPSVLRYHLVINPATEGVEVSAQPGARFLLNGTAYQGVRAVRHSDELTVGAYRLRVRASRRVTMGLEFENLVPSFAAGATSPIDVRRFFRVTDLRDEEPVRIEKRAALRLDAHVLHREVRRDRLELPVAVARSKVQEPPKTPTDVHAPLLKGTVLTRVLSAPHACTSCSVRRGYQSCSICGGEGRILVSVDGNNQGVYRSCTCSGGLLKCTSCEGTGTAQWAEALFIEDQRHHIARLLCGDVEGPTFMMGDAIMKTPPPESLTFSLENVGRALYRGQADPKRGAFHGYDLSAVLAEGRRTVEAIQRRGTVSDARVFAWPYEARTYRLGNKDFHVFAFVDGLGRQRVVSDFG